MEKVLGAIKKVLSKILPESCMGVVEHFFTVQFVVFVAVGVVNTLSTTVFATILDFIKRLLSPAVALVADRFRLAFVLGYILSLGVSFLLNTYLTFRERPTLKKAIRFPVSYIPNFIIQYGFVFWFTAMGWNRTLAYLCAAVIGIPVTFLTMKLFVYQKKS